LFTALREEAGQMDILVVDDDPEILSILRRGLIYEGYNVEVASDGSEALTKALECEPDLVVLDIMLPEIDGLEISQRLNAAGDVPVLMLSAKSTVADKIAGFNSGADDYLVKPFSLDELFARVKALLKRRTVNKKEIYKFCDLFLDAGSREVKRGGRSIKLTAQEFDLLKHPRQVLRRDFIYEQIWGYDFTGDSNVIEVYVRYLRSKLEDKGEPRLLHTAHGVGYVLRE
jgi:two-component system response regulator MprA